MIRAVLDTNVVVSALSFSGPGTAWTNNRTISLWSIDGPIGLCLTLSSLSVNTLTTS